MTLHLLLYLLLLLLLLPKCPHDALACELGGSKIAIQGVSARLWVL
jgi:hypothetical protein